VFFHLLERRRHVAALACAAERAKVHVVLLVARVAVLAEHDLRHVLRGVASMARETAVGAGQRELRLRVVIEAPQLPCVRVVAQRAIGPEPSLMMFVPVARRAGKPGILEPP
jgi:hypothetical protein